MRRFAMAGELRKSLAEPAALDNAARLGERHFHKTPSRLRVGQKDLASDAATGFNMAA